MTWTNQGNKLYCNVHNATFSKLDSCSGCQADPAPSNGEMTACVGPPTGCASAEDHERWFCQLSQEFATAARAEEAPLTKSKLADVAIKARRAANELTRDREDKEHVRRLAEQEQKIKRMGGN